jgi:hypothetical protein
MEARLRRFDGEYRWFAFRIRPLVDASGKIVKWCGLNIVIEDRRRSEEVMQRAREDHYRSIADSIPALIAFMTPAGEVKASTAMSWNISARRRPGFAIGLIGINADMFDANIVATDLRLVGRS